MEEIKELQGYDSLDIKSNNEILNQFGPEEILFFSSKIKKYNKWEWQQERTFLITNLAVYNVKKNTIQRKIPIKNIDGMTKSTDPKCSEFVIHVQIDYDYRFSTDGKNLDDIFYVMKHLYFKMFKQNLPIFGVAYANLKEFTTSKKEAKNKVSKMPPKANLLKKEDLFPPRWYKKPSKSSISGQSRLSEGGSGSIQNPDSGESDNRRKYKEVLEERKVRRDRATIYCKDKQVWYEDFKIIKVIGKGTFGKVYLVQKKDDEEIYAMKSIRKDVMIEHDQIESAKMEK